MYSNENPAAMLASQGHLAFGQDKNLVVGGRGQAATQDNLMLVKHFFTASMFCCDPCGFWEGLIDLQEEQNQASPRSMHLCRCLCSGVSICQVIGTLHYFRWFSRPDKCSIEPYYELSLPITKLRSIVHFRIGSHALPVEQGRLGKPSIPGICTGAVSALPGLLVMSGIVSVIALMFMIFAWNMQSCLSRHMVPCAPSCDIRTKSPFVLWFWPLPNEAQTS